MKEQDIENILIRHPELIEEGLVFRRNQVNLQGKRLDILFEDKNGQELIVEVKRIAGRKDIAQLMDYAGYFVDENRMPIRVMLVAMRIPENFKKSLKWFGVEYKEVPIDELEALMERKVDDRSPRISRQQTTIPSGSENFSYASTESGGRNVTRRSMARQIKKGKLFDQAKHALQFLENSERPVTMQEIREYMTSVGYSGKSYYDLFNALVDSELVESSSTEGRKAFAIQRDDATSLVRTPELGSREITIWEKVLNTFSNHVGEVFLRRDIIDMVIGAYPGTNTTSIIPSDYCYNIINRGISFQKHMFEYLGSGRYKVLGKDFDFEGPIHWKGEQVGEWTHSDSAPHFWKDIWK